MAKRRDNAATLRARNELARERGFRNYYDQRKATEYFNTREDFTEETGKVSRADAESREDYNRQLEEARIFRDAFKNDSQDYSVGSPKMRWFVEVLHMMTEDEWKAKYPDGVRQYTKLWTGNAA